MKLKYVNDARVKVVDDHNDAVLTIGIERETTWLSVYCALTNDAWTLLREAIDARLADGDFRSLRPQPELRPWTPAEGFAALCGGPGVSHLRHKTAGIEMSVSSVNYYGAYAEGWHATWGELCDDFELCDGRPCGVEEA